jgi:hypothetical protein
MFLTGIFEASFHMQMLRLEQPDNYIQLMREAVDIKKSMEDTTNDSDNQDK